MSIRDASASPMIPTTAACDRSSTPLKASQILTPQELSHFNTRSNRQGFVQLAGHLSLMGVSGYLWGIGYHSGNWLLAVPCLVIYGFTFAAMFAPLHEGSHRTVFTHNRANDALSWFAGLLSFYNSAFFRRYHKWHHRFTQIPGKDPELADLQPTNWWAYLLIISGLPWWQGKLRTHLRVALGQLADYPFIPVEARQDVIRSTRYQLAVYAGAIALSVAVGQPWFLLYWLLPLAVGQPILRAILLAEHYGCTHDDNSLANTRTTLTLWPVRFLMWNMPFHAEHHLYASIPFHALPAVHIKLRPHLAQVDSGYLAVNRWIITQSGQSAL